MDRPHLDRIHVANLLRLVFWAGIPLEDLEDCEAAREDGPVFHELLAQLLAGAIERLRRIGFERGYSNSMDCSSRPRGRILLGETARKSTLGRGELVHEHDLFDVDTLDNRVLKAAALALLAEAETAPADGTATRHSDHMQVLAAVAREMRSVGTVALTRTTLNRLPRQHSARRYRTVRFVARVLAESTEPDSSPHGIEWARRLKEDPVRMRKVFERFVYRYAATNAPQGTRAGRAIYAWTDNPAVPTSELMPTLQPDVVLRSSNSIRIVECKYTPSLLQAGPYGDAKLRNDHLRQLHSYLSRQSGRGSSAPSGLLLYPAAQHSIDLRTRLGEFDVRIATLDLAAPWSEMCSRLRDLLYA